MHAIYPNQSSTPGSSPESYKFICAPSDAAKRSFPCIESIGHYWVYSKQFIVNRHSYCFPYILLYVHHGCLQMETVQGDDIVEYKIGENQAFLIETFKFHSYSCLEDSEILWIHFSGASVAPLFKYLHEANHASHVYNIQNPVGYHALFQKILNLYL